MTRIDSLPLMTPPPCRPGDQIGIAAPASPFDPVRFEQGLDRLRAMGFEPVVAPSIFHRDRHLAGTDDERTTVLHRFLSDPEIRAVVCARGGFGSMRVLSGMDWRLVRRHPKPIVGFSDITALLNTVARRAGLVCFHGPMITTLATADTETRDRFVHALGGDRMADMAALTSLAPGRAVGALMGGNLATLAAMTGTPFMPDFTGAVVVLEDVNEPLYRIDRMLTQMILAGCFNGIAGLALGQFSACGSAADVHALVVDRLRSAAVPIVADLPIGHGGPNWTIPIGALVVLDAGARVLSPVNA